MSYLIITIAAGGLIALIPLVSYWDRKDEEKRRRRERPIVQDNFVQSETEARDE